MERFHGHLDNLKLCIVALKGRSNLYFFIAWHPMFSGQLVEYTELESAILSIKSQRQGRLYCAFSDIDNYIVHEIS